ncbi:MAG: hypothetical protein IPP93_03110 [Chitinophagaceae bacterium]|nr:hypothetical protein [Chitinophagaceae bacterium]
MKKTLAAIGIKLFCFLVIASMMTPLHAQDAKDQKNYRRRKRSKISLHKSRRTDDKPL